MKAILSLTAVVLVLAFSGFTLHAQSVDTGILGTVADSSGAIVPGASVTITQPATAIARTVVTGATGAYEVRYLVPGEYVVEVRQNGFRSEKSSAITLVIGQMVRLDFKLQVGEVSEQVQVNAEGVMLETQSGVLGGLVPAQSIVNLPLNGRNFIQLGNLTPGVISSGAATSGSFRANGARSQYQQISFDGVTAVNNRADNEFMFPSVDAVQEFKVQSSNYSAEYGGHAGANVQLQLRSGSNALHGTAFEYLRNDVLDARGYFRPAPLQKPELRRNQFGGVANGPIFRDKTFFMASYEGIRERRATASTTSVLTAAQRQGDMSGLGTITDPLNGSPFPGGIIPTNRLNPVAVNIVNQYMMLPNTPGLTNNFAGVSRSSITQDQYMGRVDHTFGPKDQIFGHYIYHGGLYPSINIDPLFGTEHYLRNQNVAFQYLHTFSSAKLNEFRFGYLRATKIRLSPRRASGFTAEKDLGISGLKVGGPNGRPLQEYENGFPQISISGYVAMGDSTGGEALDSNRSYQFVDNFSLIRGKHALKTGVDVRRLTGEANTTNVPYGQINFARDISGNPVSAFMLGYPKTQQTPEGILLSGVQQWRYGFYFQDDWRVSSRLTLNLGIRYDLNLLPQDKNGTSRTLRFDLDPRGPVLWPDPGQKVDLFLKEHNHIAPRVGFAYRLRNNLTLRGGYGIFTMAAHFDQINTLQINPPNASILLTNTNTNPLATIQNPFPASLLPANPIYNVVSTEVDRRHLDGYYQNWNLTAGYELSRHDVLELGYAGSKGTHLDTSHLNFNSPPPNPAATDIQSRRPYPQFGRVRIWGSDGNSNYHSMQARLEHRFAQGLTTTVAFTWSHLIDDQQGGLNGSRALAQDPRNVRANMRADSADDLRRSLVAGFVWDLPFASKLTGVPGGILHGWKLGGIVTLRSGSPILVTQDGDILNTDAQGEIRPNSVPGVSPILPNDQRTLDRWFNTAAFVRATTTYGTTPRNPLVGPGLSTADLSFSKSFRTREHDRIEFRFEAFNALNTPQYGNPGSTLGSTNFGRITSTRVNNREMQAALKYVF